MVQVFTRKDDSLIKLIVVILDFITINCLMLAFIKLAPAIIPDYILEHEKMTFLLLNFALVISQSEYSTVLHLRTTKFKNAFIQSFKLTYSHILILFLSLRLLANHGMLFEFMLLFCITEHLTLVASRYLEHMVLRAYRKAGGNISTILFVGNDFANVEIYNKLMKDQATGYRVLGYFADNEIKNADSGFTYLGTIGDLNKIMENCKQVSTNDKKELSIELTTKGSVKDSKFQIAGVNEIFCSLSHNDDEEIEKIMQFCDNNVIHFYYVPRQFGNYQLGLKPENIGEFRVYSNHKEPLMVFQNAAAKRLFDIVFSLCVCICMLPLFPIIALMIKLQSPGPLFFKQARTGSDGKIFYCLKFRSMHVNKDADTVQATKNDPRKFPFGNFMRKTNIDELPQFFNVLKGDMSIVGPRPHMLKHTEQYSEIVDKYMVRHFCKPGITGYAQVTGYRGETKEVWQMEERIKRDIWYIENWSFWLDLKIIFMTAKSIIVPDKNAY